LVVAELSKHLLTVLKSPFTTIFQGQKMEPASTGMGCYKKKRLGWTEFRVLANVLSLLDQPLREFAKGAERSHR
jgi:hypothetical protein